MPFFVTFNALIHRKQMQSIRKHFPNVAPGALETLEKWVVLFRDWNRKINLISRKDIDRLEERHLYHCLAITNHLKLMKGARVMDVGTGGGLPGILMAICYPQADFTLIDSIGKKIMVVQNLVDELGLKNVKARQCRAENMNRQFDFITGRAVKNLPEYFSWIQGKLRRGRRNSIANGVLYWKGGDPDEESAVLGIRPRKTISLEEDLGHPYFAQKYILYFDARDVARARGPQKL